jgi:hypothetical protein
MVIKNKSFHLNNLISNTRANTLYIVLNFIVQSKVNYIKYSLAQHSAILTCKTTVFKFTTNLSSPLNLNLYKVTTLRRFNPISNNFLFYEFTIRKYEFIYSRMLTYPAKFEELVQYDVTWLRNVGDFLLWC